MDNLTPKNIEMDYSDDIKPKKNFENSNPGLFLSLFQNFKPYKWYFLITLLVIVSFFGTFRFFQSERAYNSTLRHITHNYVRENGEISLQPVPFTKITEQGLDSWDAQHYRTIKEKGYLSPDDGYLFLYAFFPLFPYLWKFAGVNSLGIALLNFLMFSLSLMVLFSLYYNLKDRPNKMKYLILFGIPLLVVFFMPYTEATFFITLSIAFYGLIKNKYYVYFIGMFAAAMTRSVIVILLISFVLTYFLFLLKYRNYWYLLKDFVKKIAPAIAGTLAVVLAQYMSGSQKLFVFFDALKTWDNSFRLPRNLTDWSHESFSIAVVIICLMVLVILKLGYVAIRNGLTRKVEEAESFFESDSFAKNFLFYFSLIYTTGVFLTIFLFKGGVLNGIPRYVICSPFFFIILFNTDLILKNISPKIKAGLFFAVCAFSALLITQPYSGPINFSDFGMVLFLLFLGIWYFFDTASAKVRLALLAILLVSSAVWNAFLFNNFLVNGWIFT